MRVANRGGQSPLPRFRQQQPQAISLGPSDVQTQPVASYRNPLVDYIGGGVGGDAQESGVQLPPGAIRSSTAKPFYGGEEAPLMAGTPYYGGEGEYEGFEHGDLSQQSQKWDNRGDKGEVRGSTRDFS